MPLVTFHVGLHKTGTSFLQHSVFPRMSGVQCVRAGKPLWDLVYSRDNERHLLISGERLSGNPFGKRYRSERLLMLANLCTLFPGSQLLIFLREPSSWLESLYRQHLHEGGRKSFEAFSDRYMNDGSLDLYDLLVEIRKLPFTSVLALDHHDLVHLQKQTLHRVCRFVGCGELAMSRGDAELVRNVGVRRYAARLLLATNRLSRGRPFGRYLLQRGPLALFNRVGTDLVPEARLASVRERFGDQWQRAREQMTTLDAGI